MSELNLKYGNDQRAIPAPATVADAIKAFDRDVLKKALAARVNGEEVDLNKELTATDEVLSIEPITVGTRDGLEVIGIRQPICLPPPCSTCSPEQNSVSARRSWMIPVTGIF